MIILTATPTLNLTVLLCWKLSNQMIYAGAWSTSGPMEGNSYFNIAKQ